MNNSVKGLDKTLLENKLIDSILGCIYGNVLGDAYGLSVEFLDFIKIRQLYADENTMIPFPDFYPNRHNMRWTKGDWTDDSDQMILIMQMFISTGGQVDLLDVGKRLKAWIKQGFPELGDVAGLGLGQTVGSVVYSPEFDKDPVLCSKAFWEKTGRNMAANGATMRTSIIGCVDFTNQEQVKDNTIKLAHLTHYDIRCSISSIMVTLVISGILTFYQKQLGDMNGIGGDSSNINVIQEKDILEIMNKVEQVCQDVLYSAPDSEYSKEKKDEYWTEFQKHLNVEKIEDLNLDESDKIGYTYKCFGSAVYSLRQILKNGSKLSFRKVIDTLIRQGGDTDTNAAVAGALIGATIGYQQLPSDMLNSLPHKEWLDGIVVQFINKIILKKPQESQSWFNWVKGFF
ncbi:hypothetical protein DLAC_06368 [Tieghemostelium lacteum]|uniref:ADP-ribosylglycohydrolase n=1 Tax=Tieghemostelium lacteum TaxID=361077 RepID=A0A151ZEL0_TIELA|nr:hypothetical protein DLAC_06368 [Tieghemostelium lacteum]|eukprot:KYQ92396.1 hypothetical protein DLAC_06368 [Tieghemostelium lacteum]